MKAEDILRTKPWLRECHINNISNRMKAATNGNAFVVFNNIQQNFEVHTIEAYYLSGDSYNTTIEPHMLNENLIIECAIQNFSTNLDEVLSAKLIAENFNNSWEKKRREYSLNQSMQIIERVMGTRG